MKTHLVMALLALGAIVGCDSRNEDVREAQQEVSNVKQEAVEDVSAAQDKAAQGVNAAKEEAASDIQEAQGELSETKKEASDTMSGTSRSAGELNVTEAQCQRFARGTQVKPEDKAIYAACAKLDPSRYPAQ
ncbi:MAG TPA: hypothetical protein VM432_03220 [Bdellovibrionales bacterium]|nr:hypothetical protein [Bdellovibrionales bacterium]